jgi:hypothetical protein
MTCDGRESGIGRGGNTGVGTGGGVSETGGTGSVARSGGVMGKADGRSMVGIAGWPLDGTLVLSGRPHLRQKRAVSSLLVPQPEQNNREFTPGLV